MYPERTISSGAVLTVAASVKDDSMCTLDVRSDYALLTKTRLAFHARLFNKKGLVAGTAFERVNGIMLLALAYSPQEIAEPPEFQQYRDAFNLLDELWHNPNPEQKKV
jgi:hypothetical protein